MTAGATEEHLVPHHVPYHYTEWLSVWRSRPPVEVYKVVRGKTWKECSQVREQAAMEVCMDILGAVLKTLGHDV